MPIFRRKPKRALVGAYLLAAMMYDSVKADKLAEKIKENLVDRPQELREILAYISGVLVRRYFSPTVPVVDITKFVDSILDSLEGIEPQNRFSLLEGEAVIRRTLGEDDVSIDRIDWASMNMIRVTASLRIARNLGLQRNELTKLVDLAERAVESRGVQLTSLGRVR